MNDFTKCPYWGIGGRYTADPVTGVRTPVVEGAAQPAQPAAPAVVDPVDPVNPVNPVAAVDKTVEPLKENK